jgi:hypothetical protein
MINHSYNHYNESGATLGVGLINLAATGLTLVFISFLIGVNQQFWNFLKDIFNELYNRITT